MFEATLFPTAELLLILRKLIIGDKTIEKEQGKDDNRNIKTHCTAGGKLPKTRKRKMTALKITPMDARAVG